MRFAYADPPYLGCCRLYDHFHGDEGCWDDLDTHALLIQYLCEEFDAWALSATSGSLRQLLPLCPDDVRVAAWVKPFASFKKGVNPAYAWEPVIFRGARTWKERGGSLALTARDFVSTPIAMRRGFTGTKPEPFWLWLFDLLGATPDDEFVDVFPGCAAGDRAWERFSNHRSFDFGGAA